METQQPIKQKDLTLDDFKDRVAREHGYKNFKTMRPRRGWPMILHFTEIAAKDFAAYKEQQAKYARFVWMEVKKDGDPLPDGYYFICLYNPLTKISEVVTEKITRGKSSYGFCTHVAFISEEPASPYEPREKGGEDES